MSDLIDRKDAIEAIRSLHIDGEEYREYNHGLYEARTILSYVPSAEKTGKWEYIGGYGYQYRCSACIMCAEYKTNYCPHCGARMKI